MVWFNNSQSPLNKKLINKLLLILIFIFSMISFITIMIFNQSTKKRELATLEQSMFNTIQFAEKAYQIPLWNIDINELVALNKALLLENIIVAINIYNESDHFFTGMKKTTGPSAYETYILEYPFKLPSNDNSIQMKKFSIIYDNHKIGNIEIFYTNKYTLELIKSRNFAVILTYLVLMIMLLVIIYYYLSLKIIKPITYLSYVSNQIAEKKDYSIRVQSLLHDEIGQLYNGFNFMLENIQQRDFNRDTMEKELLLVKNLLTNIIQSMPSILVTIDKDSVITQWNHSAEHYFKISGLQAIGHKISHVVDIFDPYLHEFQKSQEIRYFNRQVINDSTIINIHIYPIKNPDIEYIVILAEDVTEIEEKEEQLRQAQKMESIGNLAGGIAHDFNNILGGIIGTLSIINFNLEKNKQIPYEKLVDYLDLIDKSANRAADMVQQLLSLSRKQELSMAPIDLNLTIKHVVKICKNTFDKSIEFVVNPFEVPSVTFASPSHIEQVLLNLCINSSHAMTIMRKKEEEQGGVLSISISKIFSDHFFMQRHPEAEAIEYWKILIGDTGVGMDNKAINKIFDPFYTTKGKSVGTGLGLTMVYNIVKHHNGFIDVYSEVNIGTNMYIYLPVYKKEEKEISEDSHSNFYEGKGTILIADDEPFVRRIAAEMLEMCGYDVLFAVDGEEAVQIYKEKQDEISLILLDMIMPKKSGREVFIEVQQINKDVKVLLSSGFKQDERVKSVLKSGAQAFIQKPYTLDKLSKIVYELLKQK